MNLHWPIIFTAVAIATGGALSHSDLLSKPLTPEDRRSRRAALGRRLFLDPTLGPDRKTSCEHCHRLEEGGSNNLPRTQGVNVPTVYDAHRSIAYFWDGRATSYADVLADPVHRLGDLSEMVKTLRARPDYRERFDALFDEGLTRHAVVKTFEAFQDTLVSSTTSVEAWRHNPSKFEVNAEVRAGYRVFVNKGCERCHSGAGYGGSTFVAKARRVPSLRNVVLTAPYFRDGSKSTLPEALASHPEDTALTPDETRSLIAFLGALTGAPGVAQP